MKNYDQNQDGYISLGDFEEIAANFPFSFCTHETDRWGSKNMYKGFSKCNSWNMKHVSCRMISKSLSPFYSFRVVLWKRLSTGRDKSAVKKSPLTSLGECRYVPNWATTSVTCIISMRPHIKGQRFVTHVEALWVSMFGLGIAAQLDSSITYIVSVLLQLWGVIKQGYHCKGKAHISHDSH